MSVSEHDARTRHRDGGKERIAARRIGMRRHPQAIKVFGLWSVNRLATRNNHLFKQCHTFIQCMTSRSNGITSGPIDTFSESAEMHSDRRGIEESGRRCR